MPTLVDRFVAIEEWARAAGGQVDVAPVVVDDSLHPGCLGIHVAERHAP
jgi:hypothetical protein